MRAFFILLATLLLASPALACGGSASGGPAPSEYGFPRYVTTFERFGVTIPDLGPTKCAGEYISGELLGIKFGSPGHRNLALRALATLERMTLGGVTVNHGDIAVIDMDHEVNSINLPLVIQAVHALNKRMGDHPFYTGVIVKEYYIPISQPWG